MITPYSNIISVTTLSSLLLDTYTGAAAAYSLRRLSGSYTGSAIEVRRDSDNATQDIGFVNNELDTTTLSTFCSGTDGFVTTWYDQSGNGYDATQSTASDQPKIYDSSIGLIEENGKPALEFDGSDDKLLALNFTNAETMTIHPVFKQNTSGYKLLWSHNYGSNAQNTGRFIAPKVSANLEDWISGDLLFCGDGYVSIQDPRFIGNNSLSLLTQYLLSMYLGTSISNIYANGNNLISRISTNQSLPIETSNMAIGGRSAGPAEYFDGIIQEFIIYNSDQSSNRSGIESNINDFYSIYP